MEIHIYVRRLIEPFENKLLLRQEGTSFGGLLASACQPTDKYAASSCPFTKTTTTTEMAVTIAGGAETKARRATKDSERKTAAAAASRKKVAEVRYRC